MDRCWIQIIGLVEHKTNNRFRSSEDFESYINALDIDYDSEGVTFTGYVYKLNTPQFKNVKWSADGKGTNYMKKIFWKKTDKTFIYRLCFIKCTNYFTNKEYTEEFRDFVRIEKSPSGVMTSARIQAICKNYNKNFGCFDGRRINPRNFTQLKMSFYIYNNHFCLTWKLNATSFNTRVKTKL